MNSLPAPAIVALAVVLFWSGAAGYLGYLARRVARAGAAAAQAHEAASDRPSWSYTEVEKVDAEQ